MFNLGSFVILSYYLVCMTLNFQEMLGHVDAMYSQGPPSVASGPRSYTQTGMY